MEFKFSPYIAVQVKDYRNAVSFYQRVLGMKFTEEKNDETYLQKDGINFCFEDSEAGFVFF